MTTPTSGYLTEHGLPCGGEQATAFRAGAFRNDLSSSLFRTLVIVMFDLLCKRSDYERVSFTYCTPPVVNQIFFSGTLRLISQFFVSCSIFTNPVITVLLGVGSLIVLGMMFFFF